MKILSNLFILIFAICFEGFIYLKFWQWFIMDVFNVQSITYLQAIGLSITVALMQKVSSNIEDENTLMIRAFLTKLTVFIVGFIVSTLI
jgi:hypothetical protein